MIIDVHGHIVAPPRMYAYREFLLGTRGHYGRQSKLEGLHESTGEYPDELRQTALEHLDWLDGVGTDVQLISARPYGLMHSERPAKIVHWWAETVNDSISVQMHANPARLQGVANLPQQWNQPIDVVFDELDRCVNELGFVAVLLNPDPSEGKGTSELPGLGDEYWWPLYEKLVHYQVPAIIHSTSCWSQRESQSLHFINEESIAILSLLTSRTFETFPDLKIIIPHGGGAIPYQIGRFSGRIWQNWRQGTNIPDRFIDALRQLYLDTTLYSEDALKLLIKTVGADNLLFGTERPGDGSLKGGSGKREKSPDDIYTVISGLLKPEELEKVCSENILSIAPRLQSNLGRTETAAK
jgi:predicted TIM-barrel fold metal-dependent hydrolase